MLIFVLLVCHKYHMCVENSSEEIISPGSPENSTQYCKLLPDEMKKKKLYTHTRTHTYIHICTEK